MLIISARLLSLLTLGNRNVAAMSLWPFIIFKTRAFSLDPVIFNHEKIHHRQQLELLILPYYLWYFLEYWFAMFRNGFKHHKAYLGVSFEREAFAHEKQLNYLSCRPFLASWPYFKAKLKNL